MECIHLFVYLKCETVTQTNLAMPCGLVYARYVSVFLAPKAPKAPKASKPQCSLTMAGPYPDALARCPLTEVRRCESRRLQMIIISILEPHCKDISMNSRHIFAAA